MGTLKLTKQSRENHFHPDSLAFSFPLFLLLLFCFLMAAPALKIRCFRLDLLQLKQRH